LPGLQGLSESCSGTVVGIVVNAWRTAGVRLPKDTGHAEKSSKKMNLSAAQWIYGQQSGDAFSSRPAILMTLA
jgi:hypothetical protein